MSVNNPANRSKRRPNFLFFFPDQHRYDWLGLNPTLPLRTPAIDKLTEQGTCFSRAFCTSPLCGPSRASVASGKHYGRCGVMNNYQNYPLDQPTYYQALRDAGYRVAGVGKFDLHKDISDPANLDWYLDGSRLLSDWGFTEGIDNEGKIDGSNSYRQNGNLPKGPYLAFLHERGLAEQYVQEHAERLQQMDAYTTALPDDAYCDNWIAENGLKFLRGFPADQPWHLVVNFAGPHQPMDVTASMRQRWQAIDFPMPHHNDEPDREGLLRNRQNYAAMIENIDRHLARFIDLVRQRGELDRTIIVYASDHGEMLGDHGRWGKQIWYDPSVRVPLIIAGPGIRQNRVSGALVSLHDLAATFVDYAEAIPMPKMDAMTLRPLLAGKTETHREYVVAALEERDKWFMIFDGRYKLVHGPDQTTLLFDIEADPLEEVDIAAHDPKMVARLRMLLQKEGVLLR